jgi:hypothetical protein
MATPGEIAATGAIAMRIAQMTGWVSFTLMAVYANIGEIEDGMRTLTPPHTLTDAANAVALPRIEGRIAFEGVNFAYGRQVGGVESIDLVIEPGEKLGIVGASGAGKSTLVSLLLRLYDTEGGRIDAGRDGYPRGHAGQPAPPDRDGHAGNRDVQPLGNGEHPLRPPRGDGRGGLCRRNGPRRMTSSCRCRITGGARATTPIWASAASSCQVGSGSASRWPAPS